MKRWGVDRGPGWWMLLLGPASVAWNWGPGGYGVTAWWLHPRTRYEPRLRVVQDDGK